MSERGKGRRFERREDAAESTAPVEQVRVLMGGPEARVYRVIAHGLRVQRGPGREHLEVKRPYRENARGQRVYLDSEEAPTLVSFDEHCQVDVGKLIAMGGIVAVSPETPFDAAQGERKEQSGG
jgi:hypothetical protein